MDKKDHDEMMNWINNDDCDCEENWETFQKCCGQNLNVLEYMEKITSKETILPRFKDLPKEKQEKILKTISEIK